MAKKGFDAEQLKKHQFWIVLGLFAVLWLVAVIMAKVTAGDAKKNAWKEAKDKIDKAMSAGPKTAAYQLPWNEHGKRFSDHKDVIWKDAWDVQKNMYHWPEPMPLSARPVYPDDYFAPRNADGTPNVTLDQNNRNAFRQDWYPTQFVGLLDYCDPAEFSGGFYAVFPMQQWNPRQSPTREEIWLAQEDFWVRREMLFMIREAMDTMAILKEVLPGKDKDKGKEIAKEADKGKEKPAEKEALPKGIVLKKVFRNTNWELTLLFKRDEAGRAYVISDQSTIKNVNPDNRTLMLAHPRTTRGLPFRLVQNYGRAIAPLEIAGEPLAGGVEVALKQEYKTAPIDVTKPFDVMQVLAWENSPIRRIDALNLAHHSHRTATTPLKINEEMKKLDPEPEGEAAPPTSGGGGGGGGGMMGGMGESGGGGSGGRSTPGSPGDGGRGGALIDGTRVNKIERTRYVQVTPQCKHLPVAMRLIVEQAHVHDILAAVANSRLRIQITQVTMVHTPEVKRGVTGGSSLGATGGMPGMGGGGLGGGMAPAAGATGGGAAGDSGEGGGPGAIGGGPGAMGGFPSRPSMPGLGGMGGMGMGMGGMPGMGGTGASKSGETVAHYVDTAHLVELSIYGIASLYERFPPRAKGETGGTTTPTK